MSNLELKTTEKLNIRMDRDSRRSQIVSVAAGLFSVKGFRGTTTKEIAVQAGISEATIYKHFKSKTELYGAIIDSYCNDEKGNTAYLKRLEGREGRELFLEVALLIMDSYEEEPLFIRLFLFSALENVEFSDIVIHTKGMEMLGTVKKEIDRLVSDGTFKNINPVLATRGFIGMVSHYCISQEVFGMKKKYKTNYREAASVFVDIFLNGIRERPC